MSCNSLIVDLISSIKNAQMVKHPFVVAKGSKFVEAVLEVLKEEGYILSYETYILDNKSKAVKIALKYFKERPVIKYIKLISKSSRRVYQSYKDFKSSRGGLGIKIISTPKGVMSDYQAIKQQLGGEIICEVF